MTDADRQQIAELASLLTTYFVNQQRTCLAVDARLNSWKRRAHDLETHFALQGLNHYAQRIRVLMEQSEELGFVFRTLRETARLAQQHLDTLLTLAGMKEEESS